MTCIVDPPALKVSEMGAGAVLSGQALTHVSWSMAA